MSEKITIALDAMSGDRGPEVVVDAAVFIAKEYTNLHLMLVGDRQILENLLELNKDLRPVKNRISCEHADEVVTMHDHPCASLAQ